MTRPQLAGPTRTLSRHKLARTVMRLLFVADLHYALKQFDWLVAHADSFDPVIIGGEPGLTGSPSLR